MRTWVVLLEWGLGQGEPSGIEAETVRALLETLSDLEPVALCQPDRYAVQVRVQALEPVAALGEAIARHADATSRVPLGGELVRMEILTPEELDREWEQFDGSEEGRSALDELGGSHRDPVAEAEEAIEAVTDGAEAARVLARMVRRLGGGVVVARLQDEWTMPVDITFGHGSPQVPIAEPWSVARLRLEQALPRLVERARHILREVDARAGSEDPQSLRQHESR